MTTADTDRYRRTLTALRDRFAAGNAQLQGEALAPGGLAAQGVSGQNVGDAADVSVESTEQEVSLGMLGAERALLDQTLSALERLDAGTFGVCTECGRPIGAERLAEVPYTPYCIDDARALGA